MRMEMLEAGGGWYLIDDIDLDVPSAAVAGGSAAAAPTGGYAKMVATLSGFRDRMCACKDQACVDAVTNDMAAWSTEQAKAPADMSDYTAESASQMQAVMDTYSKCMTAAYDGAATTTATTTPAASVPAAAAPARKKTASSSSGGGHASSSSSSSSGPKACVPSHWTRCGNNCYDLQNDRYNCGACGHSCPHGKDLCNHGQCDCFEYDKSANGGSCPD
jgi:hypothetical protein